MTYQIFSFGRLLESIATMEFWASLQFNFYKNLEESYQKVIWYKLMRAIMTAAYQIIFKNLGTLIKFGLQMESLKE